MLKVLPALEITKTMYKQNDACRRRHYQREELPELFSYRTQFIAKALFFLAGNCTPCNIVAIEHAFKVNSPGKFVCLVAGILNIITQSSCA